MTARIASEAGAQVINIGKNSGKGNALKRLFDHARNSGYDAVITIDADGQHDPEHIPSFVRKHEEFPDHILVGTRMHEAKKIPDARYKSMQIANYFISLASNQYIEDSQCGFRLYPLSLINGMNLTSEGYVTEAEILIKAGDSGASVSTVNIRTIYNDNGSHFRPVMDIAAITAFVISYIVLKWLIESFSPDQPFTYTPGNMRDRIRRNKISNLILESTMVLLFLPAVAFCLIMHILMRPVRNNIASVAMLNCSFVTVAISIFITPTVLMLLTLENFLNGRGMKLKLVDRLIKQFYPPLSRIVCSRGVRK